MEEVFPNIFMEKLPLTGNPLKELNCFIIRGSERNLVVDVGFDIPEGRNKVKAALDELGCGKESTDLFVTHMHEDHIGAMISLREEGYFPHAYISREDADYYNVTRRDGLMGRMSSIAKWEGYTDEEATEAVLKHPAARNKGGNPPVSFETVGEGDRIGLGGFTFRVCMFPGHTMGLAGIYEEEKKLLFAGDHILGRITPNITFWDLKFDALGEYLASLRRARELEVDHLFSAHRYLLPDMRARIDELFAHHDRRLHEVCRILKEQGSPMNVCQVAARMHWDYAGGDYTRFAITQKWFASGEAFAHLEHLYQRGDVGREEREGVFWYSEL